MHLALPNGPPPPRAEVAAVYGTALLGWEGVTMADAKHKHKDGDKESRAWSQGPCAGCLVW
jgi:hypothetical protein